MQIITVFLAGLIFGLGLILSGMTNPAKVIGFLDIFGQWDPSLALVMMGAIFINAIAFHFTNNRQQSVSERPLAVSATQKIDAKLIIGSLIFGLGWGLAGYCPGPALVSLLQGGWQPIIFVAAMLAGMLIFEVCKLKNSAEI